MQIAFWLIVGTVAVLTYWQARRTVLQPLRTEVFKLQLESMSRLLAMFVNKGEIELRNSFGEKRLFHANAVLLIDAYAESELGYGVKDGAVRPYRKCRNWRISSSALERADQHLRYEPDGVAEPPRKSWAEYEHSGIPIPSKYVKRFAALETFLRDPLLPSGCASLVKAHLDLEEERVHSLAHVLTSAAPELPVKYPNFETLEKADLSWLHNRWNSTAPDLEPSARRIEAFARKYFGADEFRMK